MNNHKTISQNDILIKDGIKRERKSSAEDLLPKTHTKKSQIPVDLINFIRGGTLYALVETLLLATVSIYFLSRCIMCI